MDTRVIYLLHPFPQACTLSCYRSFCHRGADCPYTHSDDTFFPDPAQHPLPICLGFPLCPVSMSGVVCPSGPGCRFFHINDPLCPLSPHHHPVHVFLPLCLASSTSLTCHMNCTMFHYDDIYLFPVLHARYLPFQPVPALYIPPLPSLAETGFPGIPAQPLQMTPIVGQMGPLIFLPPTGPFALALTFTHLAM